jgi:hypothetical protein
VEFDLKSIPKNPRILNNKLEKDSLGGDVKQKAAFESKFIFIVSTKNKFPPPIIFLWISQTKKSNE